MSMEVEPHKINISCEETRESIIDRLQHKFDDQLVEYDTPEFWKAVAVGQHASSCLKRTCQFLGWTLHTRNSGTEIDLEATMTKLAELQSQEEKP